MKWGDHKVIENYFEVMNQKHDELRSNVLREKLNSFQRVICSISTHRMWSPHINGVSHDYPTRNKNFERSEGIFMRYLDY